jgi:chromate transport protein ChrA
MGAIRARLVAAVVSAVLAGLLSWIARHFGEDVAGLLSPSLAKIVEGLAEATFEVALVVWYAVIHPAIQKRINPTGAFTTPAAHGLEQAAGLARRRL